MNNATTAIRKLVFVLGCLLATNLPAAVGAPAGAADTAPAAPAASAAPVAEEMDSVGKSTADHSKFEELEKAFSSGPEVTKACLSCHTEAAKQVHKTKHWTWEFINPATKQKLGKKNVVNNFCTSVSSNQTFCSACHVGTVGVMIPSISPPSPMSTVWPATTPPASIRKSLACPAIPITKRWNGHPTRASSATPST